MRRVEFPENLIATRQVPMLTKPRCAILFPRWKRSAPMRPAHRQLPQHILDVIGAHRQNFQECAHFLQVINARSPAGLESSPSA